VQIGARAAADRLAGEHGPHLPADVERALQSRDTPQQPDQYVDPISIAALIVSVATLAWTVYTDLKRQAPNPSADVIARTVRVRLDHPGMVDADQRDRIIEVTVAETVRAAGANTT
jgi:hypothetical protein